MVSAVVYHHKINNYPDPSSSFLIEKAFQGLKKLKPSEEARRQITQQILHQLINAMATIGLSPYDRTLYTSMFMVGFYGLCRVCEITYSKHNVHNLHTSNVTTCSAPPRIVITFQSFKHASGPQSITINQQHQPNSCPVQAITEYLSLRNGSGTYLFVSGAGEPVCRTHFNSILRRLVISCRLDPSMYTSHAFRIGGATLAAQAGLSAVIIQRLGRWHSNAFLRYLRW